MSHLCVVARRNLSSSVTHLLDWHLPRSVRALSIPQSNGPWNAARNVRVPGWNLFAVGVPNIPQHSLQPYRRLWYGLLPIKLRYGIATRYHIKDIRELMLTDFRVIEPLTKSIGATREEMHNFYHDLAVNYCRSEKYSTVVYHKHRLVAVCLCDMKSLADIEGECSEEIDFSHYDFAQKIANGPYEHRKANQLLIFLRTLEQKRKQLLGDNAKVMYIDAVVIDQDYKSNVSTSELIERTIKLSKGEGCHWVCTCATATASQKLLKSMNFETLYEIPYTSFREKGKPVFVNLHDSCDAGKYMGLRLK